MHSLSVRSWLSRLLKSMAVKSSMWLNVEVGDPVLKETPFVLLKGTSSN